MVIRATLHLFIRSKMSAHSRWTNSFEGMYTFKVCQIHLNRGESPRLRQCCIQREWFWIYPFLNWATPLSTWKGNQVLLENLAICIEWNVNCPCLQESCPTDIEAGRGWHPSFPNRRYSSVKVIVSGSYSNETCQTAFVMKILIGQICCVLHVLTAPLSLQPYSNCSSQIQRLKAG